MNAHRISRTALLCGFLVGAVLLAGCASGSAGGATDSSSPSNQGNPGTATNGFGPAASGVIAAITGRTLQVQSSSDQTAVTYSAKTRFTAERSTNLAAVTVGSCIVATAKSSATSTTPVRSITAQSVRIEPARKGSCGGGPGALEPSGGAAPTGFPSNLPSGTVQGAPPSGAPKGTRKMAGSAIAGKVTAIHGSTITVAMTMPDASSTTTGSVHVTGATHYTRTASATHAALQVGLCAVVSGTANNTGAVAATRIALSHKTNGSCNSLIVGGGPNG